MKPLDCLDIYQDAEFYDQEFGTRDREIPFLLKQAKLAGGPVLEVACGTGRLTLPLAKAGIEITGLDISQPMLDSARRKAAAEGLIVNWLERDCRAIDIERQFALIFSATNAMQHLHDVGSVSAFLTSAKKALRPEGTLLLDVFNPVPSKLARSVENRYYHKTITEVDGGDLRVEVATQYDSASQVLSFTLFYLRDSL
jgi:2-polyprenyl-3-methyl-5-hydroxy-6-metoxy-1,4-benzoquinol methylase